MIKHIYIHLKFNHLSIYNSCFIIHIQTQLILVSSGATCYSIGNLFIDLGPTFLLSVQPQYFRVDDDHEYDNGKKINLLIMFTCQRQINLSKKIKAVSQYFAVDQDTERKLKRCERSQDPDLKQIFCSLLVNVLRPQFCRRQLSNTSPALQDQRRKCHQKLCLVSFYYRICFFLLHKKCPDSHIFIGYVSKNGKVAAVNYVHLSFFFSELLLFFWKRC